MEEGRKRARARRRRRCRCSEYKLKNRRAIVMEY